MRHKMAFIRSLLALTCGVSIAGCEAVTGIGEGNTPDVALVTLSGSGEIPDPGFGDLTNSVTEMDVVEGRLTGYAYEYGLLDGTTTFMAVAGVAPDSYVGPEITTGSVDYTGTYSLDYIEVDNVTNQTGNITLNASFAFGDVIGSGDHISVYADISGNELDGTVYYDGMSAELSGLIGTAGLVGAFAGHTTDEVLVGGIVATAD